LSEVNIQPQVVVTAQIHGQETPREMLGHPAARPETEMVSVQAVPPSLAAPAGAPVRPSVRIRGSYGNHMRLSTSGLTGNSYRRSVYLLH